MATAKKPAQRKPAKPAAKKTPKKPPEPTQAERLVANVPERERDLVKTLADVAFALKAKLEQKLPTYEKIELVQTVTSTQGEKVIKQNPFVSEFRATARDYAAILRDLHVALDAVGDGDKLQSLDDFRARYHIG